MREVEAKAALKERRAAENRSRIRSASTPTRSPNMRHNSAKMLSASQSRESLLGSQLKHNASSSFNLQNSFVRERQQLIFMEAKKNLE